MGAMGTPYGIQITEDCPLCKLRTSGFFCELSKTSLQDLDKIKSASAYPHGSVLVRGRLGSSRRVRHLFRARQTHYYITRRQVSDPAHRRTGRGAGPAW